MSANAVIEETGQAALLDTSGKEFNAYWVDEKQNLFIPNNPLHFKAHKLQVLLARLDKQLEKNPAQFNASVYKTVLEEYTKCVEAIVNGQSSLSDADDLEDLGNDAPAEEMGTRDASGVDSGVSPDNPLAR